MADPPPNLPTNSGAPLHGHEEAGSVLLLQGLRVCVCVKHNRHLGTLEPVKEGQRGSLQLCLFIFVLFFLLRIFLYPLIPPEVMDPGQSPRPCSLFFGPVSLQGRACLAGSDRTHTGG